MKKEVVSPVLTLLAMVLIIISRLMDAGKFDWIASAAFILILASAYNIWSIYKSSK